MGTVNNVIQVKKTDFEVFDALMVDSQKSSDMSGECVCKSVITILNLAYILCNPHLGFFYIIRPLQLSPRTISPGGLCSETGREVQITTYTPTTSITGHSQQRHWNICKFLYLHSLYFLHIHLMDISHFTVNHLAAKANA